jgi:hypothetical protein
MSTLNGIDSGKLDGHYKAISALMMTARPRLWRNTWRVEIDGCVWKFKVEGYAKRHSEVWKEQEEEIKTAIAEHELRDL